VLAAVSTQNKVLLGGMAAIFIAFALASSFYFPRRNPNFPGYSRNLFLFVTAVLFVGMLLAVEFFAVEEEEEPGGEPEALVIQRL
jgi:ABC-type multidrug transport system permease subunit